MSQQTPGLASRFYTHLNGADQNLVTGNFVDVPFTTNEYDGLNEYNVATRIFQPRRAGYYLLIGCVQVANFIPPQTISLRLASATLPPSILYTNYSPVTHETNWSIIVTGICYLRPTDTIHLQVYIGNSGGAFNVEGDVRATYFMAHRLS